MNFNQGMIFAVFLNFLSGISLATELPYNDSDFACIAGAKAQKYMQEFRIDVASFGGIELCNSSVDSKKLFNDLQIIEEGTFLDTKTAPDSAGLIRGFIDSAKYYSWMKSQTRSIQRGQDLPFATAYNSGGNFTMQDGWAQLSTLGRVGTVIHEARHTAGYRHYPCDQGTYQGSSLQACDQNYAQAGSHAVEMEYYARVSTQGINFHPVYKSMARLMAVARANFLFNTPIFKTREGLLGVDENSKAQLYENGSWKERDLPSISGELKRTSAGASIFDGTRAFNIELYGKSGAASGRSDIKDSYSYFKLLDRGQTFQEFEEFDIGTQRFVVGIRPEEFSFFVFPEGQWGSFLPTGMKVFRTATTLENGEEGFFIVSDKGEIRGYDLAKDSFSAVKSFKWNSNLVTSAKFQGQVLALRTDGQIYEMTGDQWALWAPAQNQKFLQMVKVPLYDAFEVLP